MRAVGPVVVGVDGSTSAQRAARWAAREAGRRKAPLDVVHASLWPVVRTPGGWLVQGGHQALRDAANAVLAEAVATCRAEEPSVEVRGHLVTASPTAVLIDRSREARLVVVGSRGLGGFTGLMVGSVGVALASAGHCPVVVVRTGADATASLTEGAPAEGPVMVGVDLSPLSDAAVDFALRAATDRNVPLLAVHAWHNPVDSDFLTHLLTADVGWDEQRHRAEQALLDRLVRWREEYPEVPVEVRVVPERPARALLTTAGSEHAQLLVLGARGRGSVTGMLLGSTSHAALHHAPCPVAVVRNPVG
ncbi:universal stress protein [Streptoalloteichus hindustanus]|uniref:Nucleotide-binding universal stress protein, UspA family n=1 Tax=Streptoalloteichus hindustanus TaxID=2017 RepID=A0A1M5DTP0_STRHI|nr:universal stress protein [Streptoalloteichus hindustanus]SHF70357.1 Nucleotide-binding universal stress protein, UspA family [Streptoalloteichus hindustanus]